MAGLRLDAVTKTFSNGHRAVREVSLTIEDGEFLVLVGPSGCGKSTLLRLIAGLDTPTSGGIHLGGDDVTAWPPQTRDLAMVFQSYALYPHMTVRENLGYGLTVRHLDRQRIAERVAEAARALGLEALLDRRPVQLSGGQRQRVALGRAIVRQPRAFLFDEPLSNLDPALRTQARTELRRLHRSLGVTTVYVTHDQEEAMTLGSRVAVMRDGRIEQIAPPLDVYAAPANTFVATFIGTPAMNLLPASVAGIGAPEGTLAGIRPQDVTIETGGEPNAVVDLVEPRGPDHVVYLRLTRAEGTTLTAVSSARPAPGVGATVRVVLPPERVHVFDATTGLRRS